MDQNMDDIESLNKNIDVLFKRSQIKNDEVMIEGTVDTGFEKVALEELKLRFANITDNDFCPSPGRIYFNIDVQNIEKIFELRSVDNLSFVIFSENVQYKNVKAEDCQYFKQLGDTIAIEENLKLWSRLKKYHPEDTFKFRVTGIRSYRHSFTSMEAAAIFGGALNDRFKWKVSMTEFNLEILLYCIAERVTVALKITKSSNHRRNITYFGPTTLRATVCYCLLLLAKPSPGEILVDPLCGGGSIPIECALAFPNLVILCGDNHEKAIERTRKNLEAMPDLNVLHFTWDATNLPLRTNSVDIIVTDLPFGKRSGSYTDNRVLYVKLLNEFARVVKMNTGRMILLTNDRRSLIHALNRNQKHYWIKGPLMAVKLGGLKPLVVQLRRNKVHYE